MDAVKLNFISLRVSKRQTIEHIPVTVYLSALAFDLVPFECFHTRTKLSLFTPTTHNIFLAVFFFPTKKGLYYQHKQKKLSSLVIVFIYTKVFFAVLIQNGVIITIICEVNKKLYLGCFNLFTF